MTKRGAKHNDNRVKQGKILAILFIILPTVLCGFCGCTHRVSGNYPHYSYVELLETENGFLVPNYSIDAVNKQCTQTGDYLTDYEAALHGGTAPLYSIVAPQGYESVAPHIEALELDRSSSVVDTRGYVSDGKLYGFVNVYKDTVGYFAGGGNYGVEEISHGIIFEYDPETDCFSEKQRFNGCNIVAYNAGTVLYWKNKKYYSYDLLTQTEKFLIEDRAYDSGFQHQSYTYIYTNSKYTALLMTKAKLTKDVQYFYLYDYSIGVLSELNIVAYK
ncbi:MAG: hypothetical protein NC037_05955 [Bacteroides sp.]|nr:hypothetical protein [Bacillota bacterium]MCM1394126.1 hypothetical protein [[Eubacterium] siraeum]MCM1456048.1 hypothetical protein [Bacteroides sp.]